MNRCFIHTRGCVRGRRKQRRACLVCDAAQSLSYGVRVLGLLIRVCLMACGAYAVGYTVANRLVLSPAMEAQALRGQVVLALPDEAVSHASC